MPTRSRRRTTSGSGSGLGSDRRVTCRRQAAPCPERITSTGPFRLVRVHAGTIWTRITGLLSDEGEILHAGRAKAHLTLS